MLEGVIQANVISSRYANVKESFLNTRIFASEANRTEAAVKNLVPYASRSVTICEHADALRNEHDEWEG